MKTFLAPGSVTFLEDRGENLKGGGVYRRLRYLPPLPRLQYHTRHTVRLLDSSLQCCKLTLNRIICFLLILTTGSKRTEEARYDANNDDGDKQKARGGMIY